MNAGSGVGDDRTPREVIHFITQQTWFSLVSDILAHPQQLPSIYELDELNPGVSDATVYKHIKTLIDAGIVKQVALDDDQRRQGLSLEVLRPHRRRPRVLGGAQSARRGGDTSADIRHHRR